MCWVSGLLMERDASLSDPQRSVLYLWLTNAMWFDLMNIEGVECHELMTNVYRLKNDSRAVEQLHYAT